MTQPVLELPTCVVPGCSGYVPAQGDVCGDCRAAFGSMLVHHADGGRMTAAEALERDRGIREAYAVRRQATEQGELVRRANQRCWLCEDRRTCTQMPVGWECDTCRGVA